MQLLEEGWLEDRIEGQSRKEERKEVWREESRFLRELLGFLNTISLNFKG